MTIFNHFQHINLTNDQQHAVNQFASFLESDKKIFILKGYAGSGKTTLLKGFVQYLDSIGKKNFLMAPTGRAANVTNQKTKFVATTIHKGIYNLDDLYEIKDKKNEEDKISFLYQFKIRNDTCAYRSIFIVDEASMVSNVESHGEFFRFGSGFLLNDLISFSQIINSNAQSKIIFVGDPAQLPPVQMSFSPALDEKYLKENYNLDAVSVEMKEVKRQDADNEILQSATNLRKCLTSGYFNNFDLRANNKNLFSLAYDEFLEIYTKQAKKKIIICYKNKTAFGLNKLIRENKFGKDLPIQKTDIVIIGNNNYKLNIMNGEFALVVNADLSVVSRKIIFKNSGEKMCVSLKWRKITLKMRSENNGIKLVEGYMLENYLYGDLTREEQIALYIDFKNRNPNLKPKTELFKEALKDDLYFNCILLKFGYAITCHKSQGGEWENAFIFWDKGTSKESDFCAEEHTISGKNNADFFRWGYTAITRASEKLYCINPPYFSMFSEMKFIDLQVQKAIGELSGISSKLLVLKPTKVIDEQLKKFKLDKAPISLQNHFIERWYHLKEHNVKIINWEKISYEIRYVFCKDNETASFKYWVNGKNEFKTKFQKIPKQTNSNKLFNQISEILKNSERVEVIRNNSDDILEYEIFSFEEDESRPFLKILYDKLLVFLKEKNILISNVNHLVYRERYTLKKGESTCVIDFEYNGNGFFKRVLPIGKECYNIEILHAVKQAINYLKNTNYV